MAVHSTLEFLAFSGLSNDIGRMVAGPLFGGGPGVTPAVWSPGVLAYPTLTLYLPCTYPGGVTAARSPAAAARRAVQVSTALSPP